MFTIIDMQETPTGSSVTFRDLSNSTNFVLEFATTELTPDMITEALEKHFDFPMSCTRVQPTLN